MFGRQNKPSKQNAIGQGPVKEISEELKADDILGYVGNEAANLLDDPLNPDSNESNNNNALNGPQSHYGSSDLKNFKYKSRRKKDTNNALGNSLSHYSSSDLNNFKYKSGRKNRKNKQPLLIDVSEEENKDEKIQINNEIIPPKKEADHNDLLNDNLIRMKQFFAENGFGFAHPAAKKIHPELNPDNMDGKNPHDKINKKHSNAPKKKIKPFTKNHSRREKNKNLMKGSLSFIEKAQMSLKMRNNPAVNPKKRRTPQEIRIKELFKKKINAKTSGERDAYQTQLDNIYKKQLSQIGKEKENQLNLYKFNKRQKAEALKIPKKWDVEGSEYSKPNMRTLRAAIW